jgi:hypothetical protein
MYYKHRRQMKGMKKERIREGRKEKKMIPWCYPAGPHQWMELCLCIMLELWGRSVSTDFQMDV